MAELTAAAVAELMAKPKSASWMRQCGDAVGLYVKAVERPVAQPVGRVGGAGDPGDRLAYRMWSVLVESQKVYTEKYADPVALSASQATNPLDGLDWQDARNQGGDNFTYKGVKFATRGGVLHWRRAKGRWVPEDGRGVATLQALPGTGPERGGGRALELLVPQLVLSSRDGDLGLGTRFL